MRAALASLALAATLTVHAHAQEVAGALQGRVVDSTGRALPEMQVTVSGPHLQGTRGTSTDRTGLFRVVALPPGEYTVVVRRIGWREVDVQHVEVQLGRTTVLRPVVADPHPTALAPVVVEAPALSLDPIHTDAGGRLTSEEYATLPGERDYKSMIIVLPHVNESVRGDPANVDGATGLENSYYIDGVNVTSELTAATGTSLPYNFVRAVEVKTGGYEAQYGKALGAVVNAVTYSGGNDFEVSGFAFGTSSALEATPNAQPVLSESGASSYDVGVRVSGPVARDRLWYSAAYNLRTSKVDRNVGDLGVYPDRLTANVFAGKLTWHAAPATQVELSLFGDPTTHDAVALPNAAFASLTPLAADPYRQRLESGGVEGVLRVSQRFGDRVQVEGSLARSAGRQNYLPETADGNTPLFWDHVTNTVSGGTLFRDQVDEGRWTGQLRATATWRRHAVVVGAEYEDLYVRTDHSRPGGYVVQHFPTYYTTLADGTSATNHNRVPTLYAQDAWQLADNLTLNAGMRWSAQTLIGASGNSAQQFGNEWQPRVGVIWQPGAGRRQRFFASYGRFYQEEPLNLASIWFVDFSNVQSYYSADPRQGGVSPDSVDNRGTTLEAD